MIEKYLKKEVNVRPFKSVFIYIKRNYGEEKLKEFIKRLKVPYEYIMNENNWVSIEYVIDLYDELVKFTGDKNAPYKTGKYALDREVWGNLLMVFKTFATPKIAYKIICEHVKDYNKTAEFKAKKLTRNSAILEWYEANESQYICDNRRAQLEMVPVEFGLPKPRIEEIECMHKNGKKCVYVIKWTNLKQYKYSIIGAITALILYIILIAISPELYNFYTIFFTSILGFLLGAIFDHRKIIKDNLNFNIEQSEALEKSVREIETKYDELKIAKDEIQLRAEELSLVNEISSAISQALDLNLLLKSVFDIFSEKFNYKKMGVFIYKKEMDTLELIDFVDKTGSFGISLKNALWDFNNEESFLREKIIKKKEAFEYNPLIKEKEKIFKNKDLKIIEDLKIKNGFFCIPLISKGEIAAIFGIDKEGAPFTDREKRILLALSNNIAVAIDNALSYKTIEDLSKNLEKKVIERTLQLDNANKELEKSYKELKNLEEFKSRFFTNITHELKTPLTLLWGSLESIVGGDASQFTQLQKEYFKTMSFNLIKLGKMIQDLLDLSKLEDARIKLDVEEVNLREYFKNLLDEIEPMTDRKSLKLGFFHSDENFFVYVDREKFERAVVNLLSNAIKFTPENGEITLKLFSEDENVRIEIADSGIGIPQEEIEKIFDRFYQVESGLTRKYGGAGIGLSLAKEFIELHGGKIKAESVLGKGTTMKVWIKKGNLHFSPDVINRRKVIRDVIDGVREEDKGVSGWDVFFTSKKEYRFIDIDEATERRVVPRNETDALKSYKILIVEDNPDVIRLLDSSLRDTFSTISAENGEKGWEIVKKLKPHLIITDLMMPVMDGFTFCKKVKSDPETFHIPVIMLTAKGDIEDRIEGIEKGADFYISKPFSLKEVNSVVRNLLKIQDRQADILLKDKMKSFEFISQGLSHEIKNALNYTKNPLYSIKKDIEKYKHIIKGKNVLSKEEEKNLHRLEERMQKMFVVAEAGVRKIQDIILLMEKYSRDGYPQIFTEYNVNEEIENVLKLISIAEEKKVEIMKDFCPKSKIKCVPSEFTQVLTNLVKNAFDAIENEGKIWIKTKKEDSFFFLSIRDNGCGIKPEDLKHIWTPFWTTKSPQGTGLGLTIAYRVIEKLDGTIEVKSEVGVGTEFIIKIPISNS